MVGTGFAYFVQSRATRALGVQNRARHDNIESLLGIEKTLLDMETSQRGYLLTSDRR